MSPDLSIVKRLGGTDATKIDVFLFITKDFTKKVCCKFTGLQVDKFTSKQVACETYNLFTRSLVHSFTRSQVNKLRAKHITRLLVHLFTRSLFLKTHLLLVYYFSIFTAEDY